MYQYQSTTALIFKPLRVKEQMPTAAQEATACVLLHQSLSAVRFSFTVQFDSPIINLLLGWIADQGNKAFHQYKQSAALFHWSLWAALTCLSATATPAMAWLWGPPCSEGKTEKLTLSSRSYMISFPFLSTERTPLRKKMRPALDTTEIN